MNYNDILTKLKNDTKDYQLFIDNICIFMASHIHYENQINLLDKSLKSLINQKYQRCNIYLSISFENNEYKNNFLKYHSKNINNLRGVTICFCLKKTYQMVHYLLLSNRFSDKYKYIMFCDDDDTYNEYRLAIFNFYINANIDNKEILALSDLSDIGEVQLREYWSYMIKSDILKEFFNKIKGYENLLKNKFGDMYFSMFLQNYTQNNNNFNNYYIGLIPKKLYNYNKNPTTKDKLPVMLKDKKLIINNIYFRNGILLYLIVKSYNKISDLLKYYNNISDLYKLGYDIKKEDINNFVPENKKIIELTNILYSTNNPILHNTILLK